MSIANYEVQVTLTLSQLCIVRGMLIEHYGVCYSWGEGLQPNRLWKSDSLKKPLRIVLNQRAGLGVPYPSVTQPFRALCEGLSPKTSQTESLDSKAAFQD